MWITALAAVILATALSQWECNNWARLFSYLLLTLLGAVLKVKVPGVQGAFSLSSVFTLLGIVDLKLPEVLVISCAATVLQCYWRPQQTPRPIQVLFNVSNMVINVSATYGVYHVAQAYKLSDSLIGLLALAATVLYVFNTGLLSILLALVEHKTVRAMWEHWVVWSFPYYLAGAVVASAIHVSTPRMDLRSYILLLPLLYLVYTCYRLYIGASRTKNEHANLTLHAPHEDEWSLFRG